MKISRKVLYINRTLVNVNFHFHGFDPEAKARIQALHVTLSVDYCKKWCIPNRIANTETFPLSTMSSLRLQINYLNRIYTPVNIQKQVFLLNFIQCILFHFSTPLHMPTIFSALILLLSKALQGMKVGEHEEPTQVS